MQEERHANSAAATDALTDGQPKQTYVRFSDDTLLDAARACVLRSGVRRTTLTQIARTANVSRMTLYRRFPDVRNILATLMTREFGALLRRASAEENDANTARERLVVSAKAAVRELATDPLMQTVLDLDPELILPYIVTRIGNTQRYAEEVIASLIKKGHRDGSIRDGDIQTQARSVLLIVQSFVFSIRPATSNVDKGALLDEFGEALAGSLRPFGRFR